MLLPVSPFRTRAIVRFDAGGQASGPAPSVPLMTMTGCRASPRRDAGVEGAAWVGARLAGESGWQSAKRDLRLLAALRAGADRPCLQHEA